MKVIQLIILLMTGCVGPMVKNPAPNSSEVGVTRFSSSVKRPQVEQRDYVRMTRERLERESDLGASAGSMWAMEGQGAYLFAQNKARKEGDLVNIKLEGSQLKQVETKISVIKKLLEQLDQENKKIRESEKQRLSNKANNSERTPSAALEVKPEDEKIEVETIPARISERLPDGSYRIAGHQAIMLGQRQFKVLVTGLLRPEDFSDDGTSSTKLIEGDVDVLSMRKKKGEE